MAAGLATESAAVLHRSQLCHPSLGALVYGLVHLLHSLDRFLLLHHGVDGKSFHRNIHFINSFLESFSDLLTLLWQVTVIGYTMGIPDVIMGITFLAAGTSVPDCLASLIVARQGRNELLFLQALALLFTLIP